MFFDAVDLSKIIVSNEWKINDKTSKYYMPQMTGYIKYFDKGAKKICHLLAIIIQCMINITKYGILLKKF